MTPKFMTPEQLQTAEDGFLGVIASLIKVYPQQEEPMGQFVEMMSPVFEAARRYVNGAD